MIAHDDRFNALKLGNTPIQRIYHSKEMLWAEGPAWNGVGRYLVWSDSPNNVQHRWLEEDGHVSTFRHPSNNSNGNTFDWQGRQISFEHLTRSVVRYETDGTRTVLASQFQGKSLNAPNDGVVHPNGDIWFSDPGYGGLMDYEGANADNGSVQPYQKEAVYRIDASTGKLFQVTDEIFKPNGVCFSPDYKKLYVADTGSSHYPDAEKEIRVWDIVDEQRLANGRTFASMNLEMTDPETKIPVVRAGQADGIRADRKGNIWSSAGWVGGGYDGVHIFAAEDGQRIGQILLPEICSNVCFGGSKRNRLFMTASQSVYACYVNISGAHIA
jgi:gluconolactonase